MNVYAPPVDKLLALGEPTGGEFGAPLSGWADYRALGLTPSHAADLGRVLLDPDLHDPQYASPAAWAPLHAWRAAARLRAVAALPELLAFLRQRGDALDDWAAEELPVVFRELGPAAVPGLVAFLADPGSGTEPRITAAYGLRLLAQAHPEARPAVVAALTDALRKPAANGPDVNAAVIADLCDLKAVEAAPVIEAALAAGEVDESFCGDWDEVQYELGLRRTPPPAPRGNKPPALDKLAAALRRRPGDAKERRAKKKS